LTALFAALLAATWQRWPDPLVDFGRDLYIPWLMNQGAALYRDIEHAYGPLTQNFNAVLFRLFEPSVTTMAIADAVLAALLAVLIYRIALVAAGRGAAFLSTLVYVAVFAFGSYTKITNFNFISPFSHEATHGFILCLAALHAWQMAFLRRSLKALADAGFFTGLCFLTRAETSFAAFLLALAGFALWAIVRPVPSRKLAFAVAVFGLFFILPLAGWFSYSLLTTGNVSDALRSTTGAWYMLAHSGALAMPFYRNLMGTDTLGINLVAMGAEFIGVMLAASLIVYLGVRLGDRPRNGAILLVILFLYVAFGPTQWMNMGRSIPLLVAAVFALNVWRVWRGRDVDRAVQFILWATLSLALLVKIFAHAQLFHYGFYLALPAALLLLAAAIAESGNACAAAAARLHRPLPYASASIVAGAIAAFAIAFAGQSLWISLGNYSYHTLPLGTGADRIFVLPPRFDERGPAIIKFIELSEQNMEPGATVTVVPEGVSLNFLSRHRSSVRYVEFLPFEFTTFGGQAILSEFQAHPPDYIVLVDRDVTEYGAVHFGVEGYGAEILHWIRQEYALVVRMGPAPFSSPNFGMEILKRRESERLTDRHPERHK
jgi:hypothetical protein